MEVKDLTMEQLYSLKVCQFIRPKCVPFFYRQMVFCRAMLRFALEFEYTCNVFEVRFAKLIIF